MEQLAITPEALIKKASSIGGPELDRFREGGGRVVGYCCVATPRELFDAAGLLPYRIRALGGTARELADARMSRFNCSYCRSCLQLGLDGTYDFLDGLIETNGCDHLRGMFENWQHDRPAGFFHYLRVPHLKNEDTHAVYLEELELLRGALREHFDVPLSDDDLRQASIRQQRVRAKLEQVQGLRDRNPPALTGAEALALSLLECAWPPATFEALLDQVLASRKDGAIAGRARLLLAGSATDELGLLQAMEELGGLVVSDGLCYGTRAFWRETGPFAGPRGPAGPTPRRRSAPSLRSVGVSHPDATDPLPALAASYLDDLLCPRMFDDYDRRLAFLRQMARRSAVDGVVLVHNKFCDIHGVDNARLRIDLEAEGTPALVLEKEYGAASDLGRIRTRVQAFIERLRR
jgi:benzoyl-CoA reductase/2-hydroxyglutaryl-CoA dehydratase subunit BcrC/BadD/HgdB